MDLPFPSTTPPGSSSSSLVALAESVDLSRARLTPYRHQEIGVRALFHNPYLLLADEMGAGKTKQTIDAACALFVAHKIKRVLVVAPASVRSVWFDKNLGELAKHLWKKLPARIYQFHTKTAYWDWEPTKEPSWMMEWAVTNYEFIRAKARLEQVSQFCNQQTLLVLDESSYVKNHRAEQSKACLQLRKRCGRVVLLNGTPIANNPGDLYSQCAIMNSEILNCRAYYVFRSRYAVMGGFQNKQIVSWVNIDDLQRRLAPYVLRRLKEDCIDLPPKLPPVTLTATLSETRWKQYKEMRDDMVVWLSESTMSAAQQAITKVLRLAQLTSGFIGGVETHEFPQINDDFVGERPSWLGSTEPLAEPEIAPLNQTSPVIEVGREKLDLYLLWLTELLTVEPNVKLLTWSKFRPEAERVAWNVSRLQAGIEVALLYGGQKEAERDRAKRLLDRRTAPAGPAVVVGTLGTGSFGLDFTASHHVVYLSHDYSLMKRLQSEDRVHRPGQDKPVSYFNVVAVGPKGQKTIDHQIIKAVSNKENLAALTASAWISLLKEE